MSKPVPPLPVGWNKTISDLMAEMNRGERSSVGSPEVDWARAYERSTIPSDARFPVKGDVYEALEDMTVQYMTSWAAPFTGGGEAVLVRGDRVVVDAQPLDARPISVYVVAVEYDVIERRMVPESDRNDPKYSGFYFSFNTVDLNRRFKLVSENHG